MKILSVIPLKKGILKGDLTYFTSLDIPAGNVVTVPLRNKKTLALVTSAEDASRAKSDIKEMDFNLRKVTEDKGPSAFSEKALAALLDTAKYFAIDKTVAITSLVPNIFFEEYEKIAPLVPAAGSEADVDENNLVPEKLVLQQPLADRISVYKTLIRESFARKKSVFMVLPTESDITNWNKELARGIEQFTFTLHGGLSAKKMIKNYEDMFSSDHPVLVLATAPYLCLPHKETSTIILEHESSPAYRTIKKPRLDLRTFAEIYASKLGAKFIMGDELLGFETIVRSEKDILHPLYPLSYRMDFDGEVEIIPRGTVWNKKFKIFSDESLVSIKTALESKKNIFIFSLRKGLATETVCRDCGETLECEDCSAPLVLYTTEQGKKRVFVCNRCERDRGADRVCPRCRSWNLMPLGIGTDTVYEEAKKAFPKARIFKLDKEAAKSAGGARKIIKEFENEKGAILIGTEMAFYYLRSPVPISVIASFDSLWSIPNFRMSEKVLQIALRLASLTDRKMIIETKNPGDPAVRAIQTGNFLQFIREELEARKTLGYPPFARFIKISHVGDRENTQLAKKFLSENFADYDPHIFSGFIARLKGKYLTNALIKVNPAKWSLPSLLRNSEIDRNLYLKLISLPAPFEVTVDPEDLL